MRGETIVSLLFRLYLRFATFAFQTLWVGRSTVGTFLVFVSTSTTTMFLQKTYLSGSKDLNPASDTFTPYPIIWRCMSWELRSASKTRVRKTSSENWSRLVDIKRLAERNPCQRFNGFSAWPRVRWVHLRTICARDGLAVGLERSTIASNAALRLFPVLTRRYEVSSDGTCDRLCRAFWA